MAIQTRDDKLLVMQAIFQARYSDGYRFLDRAGAVLNRLQRTMPLWSPKAIAINLVTLTHAQLPILSNVGVKAVDLGVQQKQTVAEAEKLMRSFGDEAEAIYLLVADELQVPTVRVGVRFQFLAPADSLEESDRLVCAAHEGAYAREISSVLGMDFVDVASNLVFEDRETGLRRSIQTSTVIVDRPPGAPEDVGLRGQVGSGGLLIDVDTFTRPSGDRFEKLSVFIQAEFQKSRRFASALMGWIVKPRK
jgi:hypothetical protein